MATILIVDDDAAMREGLAETLGDLGHRAVEAPDGDAALAIAAHERLDAVLLDLRIPRSDGLEILRQLRSRPGAPPIAILTAYASAANTIEAMRLGAFDHLTKPIGRDDLISLISRMLRSRSDAPPPAAPHVDEEELVGPSDAMRTIQKMIGLVTDTDATVLITGETGTGKELVARAIHRHGRRASGPFVAVNCAAIPAELLESELFGHVRGAFTGAVGERNGAFRDAAGGTLFLDEVGDMDFAMQAKILRALQEHTVTPVGGRPVRVDVRVLAAPRIATLKPRRGTAPSGKTSSIGSMSCPSTSHRCANGQPTSFRWPGIFCFAPLSRESSLARTPLRASWPMRGPATFASSGTRLNASQSSAAAISSLHLIWRSSPLRRPPAIRREPSIGRRATCRVPSPAWRCT
jgi:DNA-binding response OmpR family regulator